MSVQNKSINSLIKDVVRLRNFEFHIIPSEEFKTFNLFIKLIYPDQNGKFFFEKIKQDLVIILDLFLNEKKIFLEEEEKNIFLSLSYDFIVEFFSLIKLKNQERDNLKKSFAKEIFSPIDMEKEEESMDFLEIFLKQIHPDLKLIDTFDKTTEEIISNALSLSFREKNKKEDMLKYNPHMEEFIDLIKMFEEEITPKNYGYNLKKDANEDL